MQSEHLSSPLKERTAHPAQYGAVGSPPSASLSSFDSSFEDAVFSVFTDETVGSGGACEDEEEELGCNDDVCGSCFGSNFCYSFGGCRD